MSAANRGSTAGAVHESVVTKRAGRAAARKIVAAPQAPKLASDTRHPGRGCGKREHRPQAPRGRSSREGSQSQISMVGDGGDDLSRCFSGRGDETDRRPLPPSGSKACKPPSSQFPSSPAASEASMPRPALCVDEFDPTALLGPGIETPGDVNAAASPEARTDIGKRRGPRP